MEMQKDEKTKPLRNSGESNYEHKKIDQRVRLTRSLLKNALVQLMQEQQISKISVRALCDIAGINRSTFYMIVNGSSRACIDTISTFHAGNRRPACSKVFIHQRHGRTCFHAFLTAAAFVLVNPHIKGVNFIGERQQGAHRAKGGTLNPLSGEHWQNNHKSQEQ